MEQRTTSLGDLVLAVFLLLAIYAAFTGKLVPYASSVFTPKESLPAMHKLWAIVMALFLIYMVFYR